MGRGSRKTGFSETATVFHNAFTEQRFSSREPSRRRRDSLVGMLCPTGQDLAEEFRASRLDLSTAEAERDRAAAEIASKRRENALSALEDHKQNCSLCRSSKKKRELQNWSRRKHDFTGTLVGSLLEETLRVEFPMLGYSDFLIGDFGHAEGPHKGCKED